MIRLLRALLKKLDPPEGQLPAEQQSECASGGNCGCGPVQFPLPPLIVSGWEKLDNKQFTEAIADFDQAIVEDRQHPTPYYGRGLAKAGLGHHAEAILDFDESHHRKTNQAHVLSSRGYSHLVMRNLDAALTDFTKAVRLDPNDAYSLVSRAGCLVDLGSLDQAEEDLLEAMNIIDFGDDESLDEEFHELVDLPVVEEVDTTELTQWRGDCRGFALGIRGQLRSRQGRFEEALSDLQTACELGPDDGWRASVLAWFLATCPDERFRDGSEALSLAERACSLSVKEDEAALSTLAAALAEVERFHDAVQTIRKALQIAGHWNRTALEEELAFYEAGRPYRDLHMATQESLSDDAIDDLSADRLE